MFFDSLVRRKVAQQRHPADTLRTRRPFGVQAGVLLPSGVLRDATRGESGASGG